MFNVGSLHSRTRLLVNPTFTEGGGVCGRGVLAFTLIFKGAFPSFLRISLVAFPIVKSSIHYLLGWGLNIAGNQFA